MVGWKSLHSVWVDIDWTHGKTHNLWILIGGKIVDFVFKYMLNWRFRDIVSSWVSIVPDWSVSIVCPVISIAVQNFLSLLWLIWASDPQPPLPWVLLVGAWYGLATSVPAQPSGWKSGYISFLLRSQRCIFNIPSVPCALCEYTDHCAFSDFIMEIKEMECDLVFWHYFPAFPKGNFICS